MAGARQKGGGRLIFAVDGGGTSTDFALAREDGSAVATHRGGPLSFKAAGRVAAADNLREGVDWLWGIGVPPNDVDVFVWGLSGLDTPASAEVYESIIAMACVPRERSVIVNDALLPLFGARLSAGTVLVAGTGSISVCLDGDGSFDRTGGWGYPYSDEGSGYWVGCRALRHALRQRDELEPPDRLSHAVLAVAEARTLDDLAVFAASDPSPTTVASFAPAVFESACNEARKIADEAAERLARLCLAAARRMPKAGHDQIDAVLSGSLFKNAGFYDSVIHRIAAHAEEARVKVEPRRFEGAPVQGGVEIGRLALSGMAPCADWHGGAAIGALQP